ncbi:hypothetical protein IKG28_03185 [Candidatus Saccharibacteria bacterium]|nr:hypothetical protein [Candidatus Saccharibacteria bacterium]
MNYWHLLLIVDGLYLIVSIIFFGVLSYRIDHWFYFDKESNSITSNYTKATMLQTILNFVFFFTSLISCSLAIALAWITHLFTNQFFVICLVFVFVLGFMEILLGPFFRDKLVSYYLQWGEDSAKRIALQNGCDIDVITKWFDDEPSPRLE